MLNELFENGDGFETLKRFLNFKLLLNFIDSKTSEADKRFLDEHYKKVTSGYTGTPRKRPSATSNRAPKSGRKYPNYEDDL